MKKMFMFLIAALFGSCASFPTGAPKSTCESMTPGHPFKPQNTTSPYKITFAYDGENENNEPQYNVSIFSDQLTNFKGFFIQARTEIKSSDAVGTWTTNSEHTKYVDCFEKNQSAVTHHYKDFFVSRPGFTNVTLTWTAPENLSRVYFVATVVETRRIFWTFITAMLDIEEYAD